MSFETVPHILSGWQPQEPDMADEISNLTDNLAAQLHVARDELDLTLSSLDRVDKAVRRKGRRRCLELDIFPSLVIYVGEIIRREANGQWETRIVPEQQQFIWEPWIVSPNKNAIPLHSFLYEELYEGRTCYIRSAAESEIRRLLSAPLHPTPVVARLTLYNVVGNNNEASDLSNDRASVWQQEFLDDSKIRERVKVWLLRSLKYYRKLSFFPQYERLSDLQLENELDTIQQQFEEYLKNTEEFRSFWYGFIDIDEEKIIPPEQQILMPMLDLLLLRWDKSRTWSESEVFRVDSENEEYVKAIARWSEISRGAFLPRGVEEHWNWNTRSEPCSVEFILNGLRHQLELSYYEEYIDLEGLLDINRLIDTTGYQFRYSEIPSNYRLVVMLTPEEQKKLNTEKNLFFE
ncbi:MAG: hypothetical protein SW833_22880 [Cyanobacteriota bacterium]|nr:hypothetical protein [Cyanobacteriota bacterium]